MTDDDDLPVSPLDPTLPGDGFHTPWERLPGTVRHAGPRHDAVLARDGYACAYCDRQGVSLADLAVDERLLHPVRLVVHHLYGEDDETRMSRVITLCELHHGKGHAGRLPVEALTVLRREALRRSRDWGER